MFVSSDSTHIPVLLFYNMDSSWSSRDCEIVTGHIEHFVASAQEVGHPVIRVPVYNADLVAALQSFNPAEYVVFNWCEGIPSVKHGEPLAAQVLESMGFTYTGATYNDLRFSQDKRKVNQHLIENNLHIPEWRICDLTSLPDWNKYPAIVKPAQEHAGVGVGAEAVVMDDQELHQRIAYVTSTFHQPALIQEFIDGREFRVSVLGNETVEMLPPIERDFSVHSNIRERLQQSTIQTKILCPALLSQNEHQLLEQISTTAYDLLNCRDYAGLDIRYLDNIFYVVDINPNADITFGSSIAIAAEKAGYSYGELISRVVNLAAHRHPNFENWQASLPH